MNHVLLYLMILVGGAVFGVGMTIIWLRDDRPWYAYVLTFAGTAWVGGVVRGIEHAHRAVVVIQVVRP